MAIAPLALARNPFRPEALLYRKFPRVGSHSLESRDDGGGFGPHRIVQGRVSSSIPSVDPAPNRFPCASAALT